MFRKRIVEEREAYLYCMSSKFFFFANLVDFWDNWSKRGHAPELFRCAYIL